MIVFYHTVLVRISLIFLMISTNSVFAYETGKFDAPVDLGNGQVEYEGSIFSFEKDYDAIDTNDDGKLDTKMTKFKNDDGHRIIKREVVNSKLEGTAWEWAILKNFSSKTHPDNYNVTDQNGDGSFDMKSQYMEDHPIPDNRLKGKKVEGYTARDYAQKEGHTEIVNLLRKYETTEVSSSATNIAKNIQRDEDKSTCSGSVWAAMNKLDFDAAKQYIASGCSVNKIYEFGLTPLHGAAASNQLEMADLLIRSGANISATDVNDATPLHMAVSHNSIAIAKLLIDKGAAVDAEDKYHFRPLHTAAEYSQFAIVKQLLEKGAEVNAFANKPGQFKGTPLHLAVGGGSDFRLDQRVLVVELLIERGADVNAIGSTFGSSGHSLHFAAMAGRKSIVKLLIDNGVDVTERMKGGKYDGFTSLEVAQEEGNTEIVDLLRSYEVQEESDEAIVGIKVSKPATATVITINGPDEIRAKKHGVYIITIEARKGNPLAPINLIGSGAIAFVVPETTDIDYSKIKVELMPYGKSDWESFNWREQENAISRGVVALLRWGLTANLSTMVGTEITNILGVADTVFSVINSSLLSIGGPPTDLNYYDIIEVGWDWSIFRTRFQNYRNLGQHKVRIHIPVQFGKAISATRPSKLVVYYENKARSESGLTHTQHNSYAWRDLDSALGSIVQTTAEDVLQAIDTASEEGAAKLSGSITVRAEGSWKLIGGNQRGEYLLPKYIRIWKFGDGNWACSSYNKPSHMYSQKIISGTKAQSTLVVFQNIDTVNRGSPDKIDLDYIVDSDGFLYGENNNFSLEGKYQKIDDLPAGY